MIKAPSDIIRRVLYAILFLSKREYNWNKILVQKYKKGNSILTFLVGSYKNKYMIISYEIIKEIDNRKNRIPYSKTSKTKYEESYFHKCL